MEKACLGKLNQIWALGCSGCLKANVVPDDNELVPNNGGQVPNNDELVTNNDKQVPNDKNKCLIMMNLCKTTIHKCIIETKQ